MTAVCTSCRKMMNCAIRWAGFLYDLIARSALHAQTLVGVVVESVLARLTDEQLNHLVYDKVEPDLLWIRMNGSIVGSGIGLVIFILLQLVP